MKLRYLLKLGIILCLAVLIYCLVQLYHIYDDYQVIEANTEAIRETASAELFDENDPIYRKIDLDALLAINPDVMGWLYIPDTQIDEPVLLGSTNDTYLYTDMYGSYSKAGSLFLDEMNNGNFQDDVSIIYGHNMANGSRFHDLRYYLEQDFYEAHPYIYLYLPDGSVCLYQVFASATINAASELYTTDVDDLISYHQQIASRASIYTTSSLELSSPTLLLSTCTSRNHDDRNVVFAMCIRKENPLEHQ